VTAPLQMAFDLTDGIGCPQRKPIWRTQRDVVRWKPRDASLEMAGEPMDNKLLLGIWRILVGLPKPLWQREVARQARGAVGSLGFMSEDHHRVRDFAVRELPRVGKPLSPASIAQELNLPLTRVVAIVDELEKKMTFLYRGGGEAVTWAYPVTVDRTPHRVTFSSGEQIYAA
jgi:hypothetical protein